MTPNEKTNHFETLKEATRKKDKSNQLRMTHHLPVVTCCVPSMKRMRVLKYFWLFDLRMVYDVMQSNAISKYFIS